MSEEESGPVEGDYIITLAGNIGQWLSVGQQGGGFSVELRGKDQTDQAYRLIMERMDQQKFWPSVWWLSDHGNLSIDTRYAKWVNKERRKQRRRKAR